MTDETVWIGSTYNAGGNIYHTDPECHNLNMCASPRPIDREQARRKHARECKVCAGNVECNPTGVKLGENGFDARRYNGSMGIGETDD